MKHTIADLRYFILKGPVRLDDLCILDTRRLEWQGRSVTLYALGASHAVTLEIENAPLTEVLSCAPAMVEAEVLAEAGVADPFEFSCRVSCIQCRFRLGLDTLKEVGAWQARFNPSQQMTVAYPKQTNLKTPITWIGWQIEADTLRIVTMHSYPEEERIVKTESAFEIVREERPIQRHG